MYAVLYVVEYVYIIVYSSVGLRTFVSEIY